MRNAKSSSVKQACNAEEPIKRHESSFMKKHLNILVMLILLTGAFLGGAWYTKRTVGRAEGAAGGRQVLYYVDPMNPAHTSNNPGPAPCGMPMEPVYSDERTAGGEDSPQHMPPGSARISSQKQQMMGIQVAPVEASAQQQVLRTLGRVVPDENRTYPLIAGANGWVWDVRESTTNSVVNKNQLLATIYNYDFLAREQQYLYAIDFAEHSNQNFNREETPISPRAHHDWEALPAAGRPQPARAPAGGLNNTGNFGNFYYIQDQVELAKLELYNLGVSDYQLEEIARTKKISEELELRSPVTGIVLSRNVSPWQKFDKGTELYRIADLTRVWIVADVFDNEARYIRSGAFARVSLPDHGKVFLATVTEVPPNFNEATRTLRVRLEVDNPDFELRPNMFVDVEFVFDLPSSINVPVDAVIDSGMSRTVFVDRGNGYFEPRVVETGWRFGDRVEITEGLVPGETIAVSGNFFIDSESRMKLAAAGLFGTLEKDPVCGMPVDSGKARAAGLMSEHRGKIIYFCSKETKRKFDAAALREVQQGVGEPEQPSSPAPERRRESMSLEHRQPAPHRQAPDHHAHDMAGHPTAAPHYAAPAREVRHD
jgi:membrane fusion protein, copper/silver efflux system